MWGKQIWPLINVYFHICFAYWKQLTCEDDHSKNYQYVTNEWHRVTSETFVFVLRVSSALTWLAPALSFLRTPHGHSVARVPQRTSKSSMYVPHHLKGGYFLVSIVKEHWIFHNFLKIKVALGVCFALKLWKEYLLLFTLGKD